MSSVVLPASPCVAGGGFISYLRMLQWVTEEYVSTAMDAGQGGWNGLGDWALLSPGNINTYALQKGRRRPMYAPHL